MLYLIMRIKKSQIWVETAIYTLIGLTLIAIVLSVATPQIQKLKDKSIINQASKSLTELNELILDVSHTTGNIRIFHFNFDKGRFEIDSSNDNLLFTLENTNLKFSEPNQDITQGEIKYRTEIYGKRFNNQLKLEYSGSNINIKYNNEDNKKLFYGGVYKIRIENKGIVDGKTVIDFGV